MSGIEISVNGTSWILYWNKNNIGRNEKRIGWKINSLRMILKKSLLYRLGYFTFCAHSQSICEYVVNGYWKWMINILKTDFFVSNVRREKRINVIWVNFCDYRNFFSCKGNSDFLYWPWALWIIIVKLGLRSKCVAPNEEK